MVPMVDVTSLGLAEPAFEYLLNTAVIPAITELAVNYKVMAGHHRPTRYVVIETAGHPSVSRFSSRPTKMTTSVDAVVKKLHSLEEQGGGFYGMALADGIIAADKQLHCGHATDVDRHCVVITGSPLLDDSQAIPDLSGETQNLTDAVRMLAKNGTKMSIFSTRQSTKLEELFELHRATIGAALEQAHVTRQTFRGCQILTQIPGQPEQEYGRALKRPRTSLDLSASKLLLPNRKFHPTPVWSGVLSWTNTAGDSGRVAKCHLSVTAFRDREWDKMITIDSFYPLGANSVANIESRCGGPFKHVNCVFYLVPRKEKESLRTYNDLMTLHTHKRR